MTFSETFKPMTPLKDTGTCHFDYPEVFVLILTVVLRAIYYDFRSISMALLVIITLPSLMILIYNYRRQTSFWTSNIVIILLSVVIGSLQCCTVISISLAALIGVRIILSRPENHLRLLSVSAVTIIVFYYVSTVLNANSMDFDEGLLPLIVMVASLGVILYQFWRIYQQHIIFKARAHQASGRSTMVSVINKLTRFVPPQIWEPIVKSDSPVRVSNKRAKITIMFSDIVGFTELSDSLSSDNLADILNTYMHCMTSIADKHGAVLDKFIGDGMVCFFGEPNSRGSRQDALDCAAMAIDMRREMRTLRQKWRLMGFEGLYIRVGITTGYCHVGNFGSNSRLSYTIIGKEATPLGLSPVRAKIQILVSESTYDYICHNYECEHVAAFCLKGIDEKVDAWQVLDPSASTGHLSKWVDHTLPGFNLHLNFKDMKDNDYQDIRARLNFALERIEQEEEKVVKGIAAESKREDANRK
ncbi:LOW QUALITY PROTEIN: adenylate cyclase [Psychrobacter sp. JCM 18900]|nr:LOW QUALITY PROTEIN: adenylate cyclase [Psychrobacter sp. JCM 18900]